MDPQTTAAATGSTAVVEPAPVVTEAQPTAAPAVRDARQAPTAEPTSGAAETPAAVPTPDYKRQYEGLQGQYRADQAQAQARLQAAETARQQAEQRAQRAEAAAWENTWRLQGLSPEQIRDNKAILTERQRIEADKASIVADRQKMRDEQTAFRQATEGPARQIVADKIAKEFGVPVERIAHLSHPDLMRELATEIRGLQRQGNLTQRKAAGTDRAESGGGGGVDTSKLTAHDKIKMGLKQHHANAARR